MKIQLDMYQTLAAAVLVLMLGAYLKSKIHFLEQFCIPAPVVGGLLFAIFTCICYVTGVAEFSFDDTLREVCMVFFFTSVVRSRWSADMVPQELSDLFSRILIFPEQQQSVLQQQPLD